jgi:histidinol-phosphatase (PHP family)
VLTDYHLHLRPDGHDASVADYHTSANVERYRAVARERGIAELGVSEHVYRFAQALEIWRHPFWETYAHDDLDAYCAFVRAHTDLRLGIEADFVAGAEDRTANLLQARDFDYVVGSVHFMRDGAVDMDDYSVWDSSRARSAEEVWMRYFQTIGEAARSGLFDIAAHPDLVKYWSPPARPRRPPAPAARPPAPARPARRPEGDLRRYYEPAVEGIAEAGIAVEVSTAGLRKPAGEIYPARAFLEMCVDAGVPVALSSDAHRPEDVGADYDRALELLASVGVSELCVFEGRERRLEPIGASSAHDGVVAGGGAGGPGEIERR